MLVDFKNLGPHRKWLFLFLMGTVASTTWYVIASRGASSWPSGASAPGLTFGIAAGVLILFEFLLWPRKTWFRAWRIGRTQSWLRAHIWLGLLTVPLIALHSWRELGGTLSTVLVLLFAVVIASGIWGLVLQQIIPRAMLAQCPAETIYTQIGGVVEEFRQEAKLLVEGICGKLPDRSGSINAATRAGPIANADSSSAAVAVVDSPEASSSDLDNSELLATAFTTVIEPYLSQKPPRGSTLSNRTRSVHFFRGLRDRLPIGLHPAIDQVEGYCDQRRQFAVQARMHFWLHNWLWIHLPLSAALVVLMFVHVFVALKFW